MHQTVSSIFRHPTHSSNVLLKGKVITLCWITLFWLAVALHQYLDRYSYSGFNTEEDQWPVIFDLLVSVLVGSLVGGTALVFLWERWLRQMAFVKAIFYILAWYIGLYFLVNVVSTLINLRFSPDQLASQYFVMALFMELIDANALVSSVFWFFIMMLTLAILLIKDKFGARVLKGFLLGKYFSPKREERIFMFMDLKSSTSIAEQLGEAQYFMFLNDAFRVANQGIVDTQGEIYQYVGDEIVLSWDIKSGLKKANCLRCFYEMVDRLEQQRSYFLTKYSVTPTFKAGLHSGFVIAGEMGVMKRELVYSGDVLNTAARIQSKCNDLKVNLLVSRHLMNRINQEELKVTPESLGSLMLKGKAEKVEVMTL